MATINVRPVPLAKIQAKVLRYHKKMNAIAAAIDNQPASTRLDPENHFLQFYMDTKDLARMTVISQLPGFQNFVVFFGLEGPAKFGKPTICILGADANQEILSQHKDAYLDRLGKMQAAIDGEDQYPPPPFSNDIKNRPANCLTLKNTPDEIQDYFSRMSSPKKQPVVKKSRRPEKK